MPPETHALLGASSAHRWIACPPSARLTEHLPDTPSPYAAEGTRAHKLCEETLWFNLPLWGRGQNLSCVDEAACAGDYPPEMRAAALEYAAFIRDTLLGMSPPLPGAFVEQRVSFARWVPEGFGTCDCVLISGGTLHIVDFKYGVGVTVGAEQNPQMMCYALGALELFGQTDEVDTVAMSIVQPRVRGQPDTWQLPVTELLRWAEEVLAPAARLAWEGKGDFCPGEKQCRFCKAYPTCRAWQEKFGPLAGFEKVAPALLSAAELGDWLARTRELAGYVKDLEAYAQAQLLAGEPLPGWKLVAGRGVRRWNDQDKAFAAIAADGYDPALLYTRQPISLSEAEKLLGKKRFAAVCGPYVEKPAGAPRLAAADDPRPAYDVTEGFDQIEEIPLF